MNRGNFKIHYDDFWGIGAKVKELTYEFEKTQTAKQLKYSQPC